MYGHGKNLINEKIYRANPKVHTSCLINLKFQSYSNKYSFKKIYETMHNPKISGLQLRG